jgi:hypothetical protein
MVTILKMFMVLILSQQIPPTFDELFPKSPPPGIVSVRKISESESSIKPCQPFTVVFEVSVAGEALRTQWAQIVRKVSDLVRVNEHEYKNRLSYSSGGANDACRFEVLWAEPAGGEPPPRSSDRALLEAACQYILKKDGTCLFQDPGNYRLEFFFGDHTVVTTVDVAVPTLEEGKIIEKLSTLPMLLFLLHPTDPQHATPENIATLEPLLHVSSAYEDMLSFTIGVAKGRRVGRPPWADLSDDQKREELQERLALVAHAIDLAPDSRLVGLADNEVVHVTSQLAKLESDPQKRAELLGTRTKALQKLVTCPIVPREQGVAKAMLEDK